MATFFADLGKAYRDLLEPKSKIFDVERAEIAIKAKNADPNIVLETNTKFGDSVTNKISEKITFDKYGTAKVTLTDADKPAQVELESKKLFENRLKLKAKGTPVDSGELNAKFEYDPVAASVDLKYAGKNGGDVTIIPSFVVARKDFAAGAEFLLKPQADAAVDSLAVAAQYGAADWSASAKFSQSLQKNVSQAVSINGVYRVNDKAQVGVQVGAPLDKPLDNLSTTLGGRYQFNSRLSALAKINQDGIAHAAITHDMSSDIQVSLVSKIDAKAGKPERTGVKITLGEY